MWEGVMENLVLTLLLVVLILTWLGDKHDRK